jgi:hypothetical protein
MLMRTRVGVAAIAIVSALAAAAVAPPGAVNLPHTAGANANRRAASADAHRILSGARLPAGATTATADPSLHARLRSAALGVPVGAVIDLHRFYRVPGSPQVAFAWLRAHPPAGTQVSGSGAVTGPGYRVDALAFSFGPNDRESMRSLIVSVTAARRGGTALRVDAVVVWIVPRPASEAVPRGVRLVVATGKSVDAFTSRVTRTGPVSVTTPAKVARIVKLVNELPLAQPGAEACPNDTGAGAVLKFYDRRGGPAVAQADADATGCGTVGFSLHGKVEPALDGGPGLIAQVNRLLGTHL